ncbi:Nicotinamide/nicotinic acid mononucleotide adenylyltransferase 1 [Maudiozyma exigua]|uniref:Nicotinamide-nucleotide adenylyltransferase n=1 Tax=Maudiozyma exigua TaxID=34358 RepID=A0A9P6VU75_MAUEX|nr:Nicotinamide/nicotinic acid mononucleotide adenylyltransferase 1 [Kazachstania exigua]
MDPTRAPDFKPPSPNEELSPPPDPQSTIPESDPIVPYVLADYNASIDAPFNLDSIKKNHKKSAKKHHYHQHHRNKRNNDPNDTDNSSENTTFPSHRSQHIPLNASDFQPLSADVSSAEDDDDTDESNRNSRTNSRTIDEALNEQQLKAIDIGVKKYQIADLEEVPHGIVRQARDFDNYEFPTHRFSTGLKDPNKLPLVIVACGSFSPITYLHLRMFEMALDAINEQTRFEVVGGYFSPVNDTYQKPGLAPSYHRVRMCELACERTSSWLMVDAWESLQPTYTRTAKVLDHFNHEINVKRGGVSTATGEKVGCKIMLLAGGDLIESMGEPNVWADADLHHILGNYGCLIVERTGSDVRSFLLSHDIMYEHRRNVLVIKQLIYNDISSTKVRLFIRRGMSVQYLLPNSVIRYIQEHKLYINQTEPVKQVMGGKE